MTLFENGPSTDGGIKADAGRAEAVARKRDLIKLCRRVVDELSEGAVQGARQVAEESDRWFLTTLQGVDRGAKKTKHALARLGRYLATKSHELRPAWLRKRSHRERIRSMLLREAKRSKVTLSRQEFEAFSEQIATLLDLVLQGRLSVGDIAFEQDQRNQALHQGDSAATGGPAPPCNSGKGQATASQPPPRPSNESRRRGS